MSNEEIPFEIRFTDTIYHDSQDTGDPRCTCSRCGQIIPEDQPAIRVWPSGPQDFGYDPGAIGGTEFRYHPKCIGITYCADIK